MKVLRSDTSGGSRRPEATPGRFGPGAAIQAGLRRYGVACCGLMLVAAAACAADAAQTTAASRPPSESCDRGPRYVLATSAMLRETPDAAGKALAQLPIGSLVEGACDDNGWMRVWASGHAGLVGWVRSDLLARQPPTLEALQRDYRALPRADREGRRRLAERAFALAPFDERAHRLRIETLREAGETDALARAEQALAELAQTRVTRAAAEPRLIFAFDGEVLSPMAVLEGSELKDGPYNPGDESLPVGDPRRVPTYFQPGRVYHYYHAGVDAGLLRVLAKTEPSCESDVALARRVGANGGKTSGVGIAANFPLRPIAKSAEPAPDAAERRLLERLLRETLRTKGVSPAKADAFLAKARDPESPGLDLGAARLRAAGPRVLIATLSATLADDNDETQSDAFAMLIVEPDGKGGHRVAYRDVAVGGGGESSYSRRYLDHLDLDGDGRSELIFIGYGYETWRYQVWRRGEREWTQVAWGGGGGC
ncbi:MAG: hypothetical protein HOQ32_17955 [Lysobacter sp.]|nr:hypothetical protein [Lysobacter sp.]